MKVWLLRVLCVVR